MKKIISGFVVTVSLAFANPSFAGYEDGNNLYQYCKEGSLEWQKAVCIGYVTAIADMLENGHPFTAMQACIPDASRLQLADIVVAYFKDNPSRRHYLASGEVTYALMQAFPCR
jgi:hypothetical protein